MWKGLVDGRSQRRMTRADGVDGKVMVTQRTTLYKKSISEYLTCQTFRQMDYNVKRPHQVPSCGQSTELCEATVGTGLQNG